MLREREEHDSTLISPTANEDLQRYVAFCNANLADRYEGNKSEKVIAVDNARYTTIDMTNCVGLRRNYR